MKDYLRLYDAASLRPVHFTDQNRLYFKDGIGTTEMKPTLITRIMASHAGRLTANNAFYPPSSMQAAVASFTTPYLKPVLMNHDLDRDPIGRVKAARYINTAPVDPSSPEAYKRGGTLEPGVSDYLLRDAKKKGKTIKIPDGLLTELLKPTWQGLGYIELTANITDQDAIDKIMDGRYQTVSVAFVTDAAVCSVCGQDWIADGKCDHTPGQMFDDVPCFIITGTMRFDEVSFVNRPADNLAGVLEFYRSGITDKINVALRPFHEMVYDAYVCAPDTLIDVTDPNGVNLASYRDKFQEVIHLMKAKSAPQADKDLQAILDKLYADASLDVTSLADKNMMVRLHNHLHDEYDWNVDNDGKTYKVPQDKIDLHTKLHNVAADGAFMDSLVYGSLDKTLPEGAPMPKDDTGKDSAKSGVEVKDKDKSKKKDPKKKEKDPDDDDGKDPDDDDDDDKKKKKKDGAADSPGDVKNSNDNTDTSATETKDEELLDLEEILDEEKCYALLEAELEAMAVDMEAADAEGAQLLRDAKLSTKTRKGLKASTFCGPNRSFPVPDCAHVTAARRLIGRYKGPGKKESILACVARKAKALGCGGAKKDEVDACAGKGKDELLEQRQELLDQVSCIETELKDRFDTDFTVPCTECATKDAELVGLKAASLIDTDQLDALELDFQASQDEIKDLKKRLSTLLAQQIVDRRQLANRKPMTDEEVTEQLNNLQSRSLDSIQDTWNDLEKQTPLSDVLKPFIDGMGNQPTEAVTNPTIASEVTDDDTVADEALKKQIMHMFNRVSQMSGSKAGEAYLNAMTKQYPKLNLIVQQ